MHIPANAQVNRKMIGHPDGVLRESSIVVAVGVRERGPETLQIVFRDRVRISTEWRERQSTFHRFEGKRIDLDNVEEILAALLTGKVIVDPCDERIAAELERVPAGIEAESFGKLAAALARGARKLIGASNAVDDVRNLTSVSVVLVKDRRRSRENWARR